MRYVCSHLQVKYNINTPLCPRHETSPEGLYCRAHPSGRLGRYLSPEHLDYVFCQIKEKSSSLQYYREFCMMNMKSSQTSKRYYTINYRPNNANNVNRVYKNKDNLHQLKGRDKHQTRETSRQVPPWNGQSKRTPGGLNQVNWCQTSHLS